MYPTLSSQGVLVDTDAGVALISIMLIAIILAIVWNEFTITKNHNGMESGEIN